MESSAVSLPAFDTGRPAPEPTRRRGLPRWLGIVFPAQAVLGAGFAAVFWTDRSSLPYAVMVATPIGLGLAAGALARWSMPGRATVLRWLVALEGVTLGLLSVGLLTGGAAGVFPAGSDGRVQWTEIGEIAAAAFAAVLPLLAWRKLSSGTPFLAGLDGLTGPEPGPAVPPVMGPLVMPARPAAVAPIVRPDPGPRPSTGEERWWRRAWRATGGRLRPQPGPRLTKRTAPPARRRRPRRGAVRLTGVEENRCPYCLSPVTDSDPRGVVVCPVCRTPHHADCWAVTGACQVPHAYESRS